MIIKLAINQIKTFNFIKVSLPVGIANKSVGRKETSSEENFCNNLLLLKSIDLLWLNDLKIVSITHTKDTSVTGKKLYKSSELSH